MFQCPQLSSASAAGRTYREALNLYENGMYERARALFETLGGDPLAEGYCVLCAMKLRSADAAALWQEYRLRHSSSSLVPLIRLQNAFNLFDEKRYAEAGGEFAQLSRATIPSPSLPEATFKEGYCAYVQGYLQLARAKFAEIEAMQPGEYTSTSRYLTGYMDYCASDFDNAVKWFSLARSDRRFEDLSRFYLVDCKFNLKDYEYVIEEGEAIYESVPEDRRGRLSRMISESYLVAGRKQEARRYYDSASAQTMTRSDYFYAGSVLYAVSDYKGAVENFSHMEDRSDSLGQIANYQMANSYLHLRNNVAAMECFKAASAADFDKSIKEDASFNYAKLAFDLNKDTSGFKDYIAKYSTRAKGNEIYSYMAIAALADHDYAGAVDAYDNIDELSDGMIANYTKANYLRAEQMVRQGAWSDAIPCLRAAAYYLPRTDHLNQLSRYWLAESQYATGNWGAAREIYTDLYNSDALHGREESRALAYNIAYCDFNAGEFESSARWFDTALGANDPYCREDALVRRADCDFGREDYKASVVSYQKVLDDYPSPDNVYPRYQLALSYGLSKDRKDRKKKAPTLASVLDASPASPMYDEAVYELGRTYMESKENSKALSAFTALRTTTLDSTWVARALMGMGMVNRNTKSYDAALSAYKEVVSKMPGSEYADESMLAIEGIYKTLKQPQKYQEYVEMNKLIAERTEQDRERMSFTTAEQVYLTSDARSAVASLQKFVEDFPGGENVPQALYYIGESYKSLGEKEKARDAYRKSVDASPDGFWSESARLGYASTSYALERYADARDAYAALLKSASVETNRASARTGLMRSAFRAKSYNQAIEAAEAVGSDVKSSNDVRREADYIKAKSYLATSRRDKAMPLFASLSKSPSTPEGAEAECLLIQNLYDTADFDKVEARVREFSQKAGDQSYWLAKAYVVLADSFLERNMKDEARATLESIRDGYEASGVSDDVPDNVKLRLLRLQTK